MQNFYAPYNSTVPISPIEGFKWSLSDDLDPFTVSVSRQSTKYSKFLKCFQKARTFDSATPEQYAHLIHLLQCSILGYSQYVNKLKSQILKLKNLNKELKNKTTARESFICPVCLDPLKSLLNLDQHMNERHPNALEKWNSLRCEALSGVPLKQTINERTKDPEVAELHDWMMEKFDYLESLIVKKSSTHHHNRHNDTHSKMFNNNKIPIPNSPSNIQPTYLDDEYDDNTNNTNDRNIIITNNDKRKSANNDKNIFRPKKNFKANNDGDDDDSFVLKKKRPRSQEFQMGRDEVTDSG